MAGFQVAINGRFWVATEDNHQPPKTQRLGRWMWTICLGSRDSATVLPV